MVQHVFSTALTRILHISSSKHDLQCFWNAEEFGKRVEQFRRYLMLRPEEVLAVVTHFGVLEHMTGHMFTNCEIWSCAWEDGYCIAEHQSSLH